MKRSLSPVHADDDDDFACEPKRAKHDSSRASSSIDLAASYPELGARQVLASAVLAPDGIARCSWSVESPQLMAYHDSWGLFRREDMTNEHVLELMLLAMYDQAFTWRAAVEVHLAMRALMHSLDLFTFAHTDQGTLEATFMSFGIGVSGGFVDQALKLAGVFIELCKTYGTLLAYFESFFVMGPVMMSILQILPSGCLPTYSQHSKAVARDLASRGLTFVTAEVAHCALESMGLINNHTPCCFMRSEMVLACNLEIDVGVYAGLGACGGADKAESCAHVSLLSSTPSVSTSSSSSSFSSASVSSVSSVSSSSVSSSRVRRTCALSDVT